MPAKTELSSATMEALRIEPSGRSVPRNSSIYALHALFALLIVAVLLLVYQGYGYYSTPVRARFRSELHEELKPGGRIGHALGMTSGAMLIGLLSYSLRKRAKFLRGRGHLSTWLQFHIFLGIAGPILITFHTAFKFRGIVAISYWSMVLVALSGMIGRYLYAQIPHAISGREMQQKEITNEIEAINIQLSTILPETQWKQIQRITDYGHTAPKSSVAAILLSVADDIRWLIGKRSLVRVLNSSGGITKQEKSKLIRLARSRELQLRRIATLKASQNLFRHWHIIHLPLAQTMYLTMVIHIFVAIMTGYF